MLKVLCRQVCVLAVCGSSLLSLVGCTSKTERDYITGCIASGGPKEVCSCAYDKLEDTYAEEVFSQIEKGSVPDDFMETNIMAMKSCMADR